MEKTTSTLIIALAPFSDAALAVGPLAARREERPDERVTFAGVPGVCEVVASLGLADAVVEAPAGTAATRGRPGAAPASGAVDLVKAASFVAKLRRGRYDAVVDLFPKLGSTVASWLAAGSRATSSTSRYLDAFFKAKSAAQGGLDPVDRISALLGVHPDSVALELAPDPENDAWIERALGATGYAGGPIVVAHTAGRWELDEFADVVGRLRSAFGAWTVALDTPREGGRAKQLAGAIGGRVLGVAAPAGGRLVASLARASLVVTDDTSVAYLAWLALVRVVLVTSPGPYSLATRAGLRTVDVSGGGAADEVYDAACELISAQRTGRLFDRK